MHVCHCSNSVGWSFRLACTKACRKFDRHRLSCLVMWRYVVSAQATLIGFQLSPGAGTLDAAVLLPVGSTYYLGTAAKGGWGLQRAPTLHMRVAVVHWGL